MTAGDDCGVQGGGLAVARAAPLHACFDFRFASDIPLGELALAASDDVRDVVTIRVGTLPDELVAPDYGLAVVGEDVLLCVPGVARYLIRGRDEIVVAPVAGASDGAVRLFLLGSAIGILAYRRGLLPLHANAIVVNGGAYAFAGPSGAGKSTLAAHFAAAGHEVLCDDVCALSFAQDGQPCAWPGLPRVKLWEDAARSLGHDPATLDRVVDGHQKFHVAIPAAHAARALPLKRLYVLSRAADGEAGTIARLTGTQAMAAVMENSYRHEYLPTLGLTTWHFQRAAAMLAHVEVYAVSRAWGFDVFEREAERLAAHVAAA